MGHGTVQRKTLFWGFGKQDGGALSYMGVPGPAAFGGFTSGVGANGFFAAQDARDGYQRLLIPAQDAALGPIRAIAIAPDSAIHSCDISLAGRDGEIERHRVSPGNPLLGCLDNADYAMISIPNPIPAMDFNQGLLNVLWDARQVAGPVGTNMAAWPLRLELWRGDVLPIRSHRRAPYHACGVLGIQSGLDGGMVVCVDGRRRIDLNILNMNTVTLTAFQCEAFPPNGTDWASYTSIMDAPYFQQLTIDGALSQTLPTTTPLITGSSPYNYSFEGNPMSLLHLRFSTTVGSSVQIACRVTAWDD